MTEITIRETDTPSRSKQAGPCWIRVAAPETYAATRARVVDAELGATITVEAKVSLRRATRTDDQRTAWTLRVTGNPADIVRVRLGSPQAVEAEIVGVTSDSEQRGMEVISTAPAQIDQQQEEDVDAAQLVTALRSAGRTVADIAATLGVHASTVYRWARATFRPNPARLAALAAMAAA